MNAIRLNQCVLACAVMAAATFAPSMASAQFGNILKDLKAIEDSLRGNQKAQGAVGASEQPKISQNNNELTPVGQAQSAETNSGYYSGTYKRFYKEKIVESDVFTISNVDARKFNFGLSLINERNLSIGEIEGVAKISGNGFVYENEELNCKLIYRKTGEGVAVEQLGSCGFGSGVVADGEYRRVAKKLAEGVSLSPNQFGYLKEKIKTFEGAGCSYYRKEDEKNKNPKYFAADDYDGQGIVINMNGSDILLSEKARKVNKNHEVMSATYGNSELQLTIKFGASKICGEECSKNVTTFDIGKGSQKISIPTYSICGS